MGGAATGSSLEHELLPWRQKEMVSGCCVRRVSSQPPAVVRGQLRKLEADSCVSVLFFWDEKFSSNVH